VEAARSGIIGRVAQPGGPRVVGVVLFEGFELLDVFGPLEIFGSRPEWFGIELVGPAAGPVGSTQGARAFADVAYDDARVPEIVLVPGGMGTRRLVEDAPFLGWLGRWAGDAAWVTSVCTGSGVLAAAGLLDGFRATSNKRAFAWARTQASAVAWVPQARWVADRNRWTSSGVAAGIDMALGLVSHLHDEASACALADEVEYEWHRDSSWDPFAAKNGLVGGI
jgi:transcriptional regulator GlxA family with amidase domain